MQIIENVDEFDAVLRENELVFADFYADWCGPCKMLAPIVEELETEQTDVKFVKVNVDDIPDLAERYGIMSIPALFVFKNGETAGQTLGFQPKANLKELLASAR